MARARARWAVSCAALYEPRTVRGRYRRRGRSLTMTSCSVMSSSQAPASPKRRSRKLEGRAACTAARPAPADALASSVARAALAASAMRRVDSVRSKGMDGRVFWEAVWRKKCACESVWGLSWRSRAKAVGEACIRQWSPRGRVMCVSRAGRAPTKEKAWWHVGQWAQPRSAMSAGDGCSSVGRMLIMRETVVKVEEAEAGPARRPLKCTMRREGVVAGPRGAERFCRSLEGVEGTKAPECVRVVVRGGAPAVGFGGPAVLGRPGSSMLVSVPAWSQVAAASYRTPSYVNWKAPPLWPGGTGTCTVWPWPVAPTMACAGRGGGRARGVRRAPPLGEVCCGEGGEHGR